MSSIGRGTLFNVPKFPLLCNYTENSSWTPASEHWSMLLYSKIIERTFDGQRPIRMHFCLLNVLKVINMQEVLGYGLLNMPVHE